MLKVSPDSGQVEAGEGTFDDYSSHTSNGLFHRLDVGESGYS
jgi:hypothetical protein